MCVRERNTLRKSARRGAAAIEFAVILPVLILIVLGCVDFGRFAYSYIAVSNAARAGAGYGCVHPFTDGTKPTWEANIRQAAADEMQLIADFDPNQVQITSSPQSVGDWWVTVDVAYSFHMIVNWPALPNEMTLRRTVTMPGIRSN